MDFRAQKLFSFALAFVAFAMAFSSSAAAGSVYGYVFDNSTGTPSPIANANVSAINASYVTASSLTNAAGFYNITGLNDTNVYHDVQVSAPGYQTIYASNYVKLTPTSPDKQRNFTIVPVPSGLVNGTVANSTGSALANANLTASQSGVAINSTLSSSNGVYSMALPPGVYNLTIVAAAYGTQTASLSIASNSTFSQDFVLVPLNGTIEGYVYASGGAALGGAAIAVASAALQYATSANASGYYVISVPTGTYNITASSSGYYSSTSYNNYVAPSSTAQVNFTLSAVPSGGGGGGSAYSGGYISPKPSPSPTPTPTPAVPSPKPIAEGTVVESASTEYTQSVVINGTAVEFGSTRSLTVTKDSSKAPKSGYLSTFTLKVKNKGNATLFNVVIKERITEAVAASAGDIAFKTAPSSFEEGSVVAAWNIVSLASNEEIELSYSIDKKLTRDALNAFSAPQIQQLAISLSQAPSPTPSPSPAPGFVTGMFTFATTGTGIAVLLLVVAVAAIAVFAYTQPERAQAAADSVKSFAREARRKLSSVRFHSPVSIEEAQPEQATAPKQPGAPEKQGKQRAVAKRSRRR